MSVILGDHCRGELVSEGFFPPSKNTLVGVVSCQGYFYTARDVVAGGAGGGVVGVGKGD